MGLFDWVKDIFGGKKEEEVPDYMLNNGDDETITLTAANGEEVDFIRIAGIALGKKYYAILQPEELLDGMDDDEALVFRVTKGADGEDSFEIVTDDRTVDAVFREYNRLLDEM